MKVRCAHCGKWANKPTGAVNRSRKRGARIFCNRKCAGLGRRDPNPPTEAERKEAKRIYDAKYRADWLEAIRVKKHKYFVRTYDPVKAATERKKRMPYHVEYCRSPEYRAYKQQYDLRRRAREYGEWADAYLLTLDIDREVNARMSDYEVRMANGTINKKHNRRLKDEIADRA